MLPRVVCIMQHMLFEGFKRGRLALGSKTGEGGLLRGFHKGLPREGKQNTPFLRGDF